MKKAYLDELNALKSNHQNQTVLALLKSDAYIEREDYTKAIDTLRAIHLKEPKNKVVSQRLVSAYVAHECWELADETLKTLKAPKDIEQRLYDHWALQIYAGLLQINSDHLPKLQATFKKFRAPRPHFLQTLRQCPPPRGDRGEDGPRPLSQRERSVIRTA